MKYFSTFSGIGGFEKGIEQSGVEAECVGFSEIDKYAKAIYQYHFNHKDYGDITTINESELPDFDLFVGGFPCQAFSIAGKRQGFEDTRGTLFFDVARILSAKKPKWFILENVKGLLNHDAGRTIATIYRVLTDLGYTVGWEVVNSCQFGVPQNRERIFIIGYLGKGSLGEVFPFRDSKEQDHEENLFRSDNGIAGTLNTKNNSGQLSVDKGTVLISDSGRGRKMEERDVVPPLRSNTGAGFGNYLKVDKKGNRKKNQEIAACLTGGGHSGGNHSDMDLLKVGTWRTHKDGNGFREVESGLAPTIPARAREDGSGQPVVRVPEATKKGYAEAKEGQAINLSVPNSRTRRGRVSDVAHTIDTNVQQYTLQNISIRRLTPIECERLQGFEDEWTKHGIIDGKQVEISDTQRYKTLGNAVTVNVIEAVIRKIIKDQQKRAIKGI